MQLGREEYDYILKLNKEKSDHFRSVFYDILNKEPENFKQ